MFKCSMNRNEMSVKLNIAACGDFGPNQNYYNTFFRPLLG